MDSEPSFECNICGRKFMSRTAFEAHHAEHQKCATILELSICPGDTVIVWTGRHVVRGKAVSVSGSSIIVNDGSRLIGIKKNKINAIEKHLGE